MIAVAGQPSIASVLIELLPLMIAAAIVPVPIITVLLLLGNEDGLSKGAALVGGAIVVRLLQGLVFGLLLASDPEASTEAGGNLIVSVLLMLVGIVMLIAAYRKWDKEEDPDAPPPKWMAALGGLSTLKAVGIGAGLVAISTKQWVFTLSAIGVLNSAQLGPPASLALFLIYVLAAQVFGLAVVIASMVAPRRAGSALARANTWLERNNRTILVAASLIFGLYFLFKGVTGLIG
jgi:hypothetical protein